MKTSHDNENNILISFRTNLIQFLDELIEQFPEEGDLVVVRLFISNQIPVKDLVEKFVEYLEKNNQKIRKLIKNRDDDTFLKHNFFEVYQSNINHFKNIWKSGSLDEHDRNIIWRWLDTLVFFVDKYIEIKKIQT